MATRRPNVPRVSPAARAQGSVKAAPPGAEVIRADFGAAARIAAEKSAGEQHFPVTGGNQGFSAREGSHDPGRGGTPGNNAPGTTRQQHGPVNTGAAQYTGNGAGNSGLPPAGTASAEDADPVPAKLFSGRMLALAVVMIAITVLLAPTVKIYIDKSAEISALNDDIAVKRAEQAALNQQILRWQDPNYVKQQARDRINMVMPGETSYWVYGSDEPADTSAAVPGGEGAVSSVRVPWVDGLWESVRRSGSE